MQEHEWVEDVGDAGAMTCGRNGCAIRRTSSGQSWQKRKGAHWRRVAREPIPPCVGADTPPAQPSALERAPVTASPAFELVRDGLRSTAAHKEGVVDADALLASLVAEVRGQAANEALKAACGSPNCAHCRCGGVRAAVTLMLRAREG